MTQPIEFLQTHWLPSTLAGFALCCALAVLRVRRRRQRWSAPLLVVASAALLLALGGFFETPAFGFWLGIGSVAGFFLLIFVMVLTGFWSVPVAWIVAAVGILGLGGYGSGPVSEGLEEAYRFVRNLKPLRPWWLLLLALIPAIILLSFRSLSGLGPVRRWAAIGLRCALVLFLTLALAEAATTTLPETTTVLFVLDGSQSVPKELLQRAEMFINEAVGKRGAGHERDKAGLVVFGKEARPERP